MAAIPLVIVGAGGFAREVHDIVEAINAQQSGAPGPRFAFLGFLADDPPDAALTAVRGPYLGDPSVASTLPEGTRYAIGIGSGPVRRRIDEAMTAQGREPAVLIHPSATFGSYGVRIGAGTIVCAHCSLTSDIVLGRHVNLNLNVTVGHDARLGDYVTVNPGATISGAVELEDEVSIGTGASIIQGRRVGRGSIIGAGASVVRDIPAGVTAVGVPARPR